MNDNLLQYLFEFPYISAWSTFDPPRCDVEYYLVSRRKICMLELPSTVNTNPS